MPQSSTKYAGTRNLCKSVKSLWETTVYPKPTRKSGTPTFPSTDQTTLSSTVNNLQVITTAITPPKFHPIRRTSQNPVLPIHSSRPIGPYHTTNSNPYHRSVTLITQPRISHPSMPTITVVDGPTIVLLIHISCHRKSQSHQ